MKRNISGRAVWKNTACLATFVVRVRTLVSLMRSAARARELRRRTMCAGAHRSRLSARVER